MKNLQREMKLRHYHLSGLVSYQTAASLQDQIVTQFLASKASKDSSPSKTFSKDSFNGSKSTGAVLSPSKFFALVATPHPSVITAQFYPVYTCGRREVGKVTTAQERHLRANGRADFVEALRGGQTTFHGPGQLVAYPILDLRDRHMVQLHNRGSEEGVGGCEMEKQLKQHGSISARKYISILEQSVIATCAAYGVKSFTTEHPGVWTTPEKKIAALGVHLRRHVTSHGIGLNVSTDMWWFDRIVACGLEGKKTTSLEAEGARIHGNPIEVDAVAKIFVAELAKRLGLIDEIEIVDCAGFEEK